MMVRVLVFIFGAALLPTSLFSTSTESLQEHKHGFIASKFGQYHGEVACFTSLRRKPFYSFISLL